VLRVWYDESGRRQMMLHPEVVERSLFSVAASSIYNDLTGLRCLRKSL
jgi:hypothetical protein